ncbi:hypothetical protein, partial [Burkholderia pseudomallei]|uniref:hypothetical protein n=1 Tax=Burkholderia pseudomallei TaxID=28450 RepID=UPI001E4B6972
AASATFALNAAECVRRVLFVISSVPLPALSLAQATAKPLIRLSEFARPPLFMAQETPSGRTIVGGLRQRSKLRRNRCEA